MQNKHNFFFPFWESQRSGGGVKGVVIIDIKEPKKLKWQIKEVMSCDVLPLAMFCIVSAVGG